jgi:hypothetical protein
MNLPEFTYAAQTLEPTLSLYRIRGSDFIIYRENSLNSTFGKKEPLESLNIFHLHFNEALPFKYKIPVIKYNPFEHYPGLLPSDISS